MLMLPKDVRIPRVQMRSHSIPKHFNDMSASELSNKLILAKIAHWSDMHRYPAGTHVLRDAASLS